MSYTYDAADASNLVKEGDYEALIERIERKTVPSGKEKLSVMYRIRSDVEQPYGNKPIFEDIWEEKNTPGVFNRKRINQLLGTQEIKDGTEFETINDIIKFLDNAPLIIHIGKEFDDWKGEDVNKVSYYKRSKAVPKQVGGGESQEQPKDQGVVVGDDDELPF